MSQIRSRDTKPEVFVRKLLHSEGFRFRVENKNITGKPDIFLRKHNLAVFVHGCFWHRHNCPYGTTPATNKAFWIEKLERNAQRDAEVKKTLLAEGVRILVVWECAIKGKMRLAESELRGRMSRFVSGNERFKQIRGGAKL